MAEWTWDRVSPGVTWLAECFWDGVKWTGKLITPTFNYVTDVVTKFYAGYLDSK